VLGKENKNDRERYPRSLGIGAVFGLSLTGRKRRNASSSEKGNQLRWQRLTLPPSLPGSTISADELNFRVRDGTGWTLTALATNTRHFPPPDAPRFFSSLTCSTTSSKQFFYNEFFFFTFHNFRQNTRFPASPHKALDH
jgi:hypothetical protein